MAVYFVLTEEPDPSRVHLTLVALAVGLDSACMYADMYSTGGEGLEGAKGEVLYVSCLSSEYDKESI